MKLVDGKSGLTLRLGAMIVALLVGQQAMAVGTRAGTTITNVATVDYEVGGVNQADISSDPLTAQFVVDRRVDFTLAPASTGDLVPVNPSETDVWVDFILTNTSNSDLDFALSLAQSGNGDNVDGFVDDADMQTIDYAVVTAADPTPTRGGEQYVNDLVADGSVRIRVFGDAAAAMLNGEIAGAELTATAVDPTGTSAAPGAPLPYGVANGDMTIENVAANGSGVAGVEVTTDGFIVEAANLSVSKSYTVDRDDLGSGLPIPGAVIRYEIIISNGVGAEDATDIVVTDVLDGNLTFLTGPTSAYTDIQVDDGGGAVECTGDDPGVDTDGCSFDGTNLVVGGPLRPITIAEGGSYTVRFEVRVNDPATTP